MNKNDDSARHTIPETDQMIKYHGEIMRMLDASEVLCNHKSDGIFCKGEIEKCPFKKHQSSTLLLCNIARIRLIIGDLQIDDLQMETD